LDRAAGTLKAKLRITEIDRGRMRVGTSPETEQDSLLVTFVRVVHERTVQVRLYPRVIGPVPLREPQQRFVAGMVTVTVSPCSDVTRRRLQRSVERGRPQRPQPCGLFIRAPGRSGHTDDGAQRCAAAALAATVAATASDRTRARRAPAPSTSPYPVPAGART